MEGAGVRVNLKSFFPRDGLGYYTIPNISRCCLCHKRVWGKKSPRLSRAAQHACINLKLQCLNPYIFFTSRWILKDTQNLKGYFCGRQRAPNMHWKIQKLCFLFLLPCPHKHSVFVCLSMPVCSWLCFRGSGRSLELFAPGSRTVVQGSGRCLGSLEDRAVANPAGPQEERRREPPSLWNNWCIVRRCLLPGWLTVWDA